MPISARDPEQLYDLEYICSRLPDRLRPPDGHTWVQVWVAARSETGDDLPVVWSPRPSTVNPEMVILRARVAELEAQLAAATLHPTLIALANLESTSNNLSTALKAAGKPLLDRLATTHRLLPIAEPLRPIGSSTRMALSRSFNIFSGLTARQKRILKAMSVPGTSAPANANANANANDNDNAIDMCQPVSELFHSWTWTFDLTICIIRSFVLGANMRAITPGINDGSNPPNPPVQHTLVRTPVFIWGPQCNGETNPSDAEVGRAMDSVDSIGSLVDMTRSCSGTVKLADNYLLWTRAAKSFVLYPHRCGTDMTADQCSRWFKTLVSLLLTGAGRPEEIQEWSFKTVFLVSDAESFSLQLLIRISGILLSSPVELTQTGLQSFHDLQFEPTPSDSPSDVDGGTGDTTSLFSQHHSSAVAAHTVSHVVTGMMKFVEMVGGMIKEDGDRSGVGGG